MFLTLKNARRLDSEIQSALSTLQSQVRMANNVSISFHDDFDKKVEKAQRDVIELINQHNHLSSIRFGLRRAIETKNEMGGLNEQMNEEAALREEQLMLEQLLAYYQHPTSGLTEDRLNAYKRKLDAIKTIAQRPGTESTEDSVSVGNVVSQSTIDNINDRVRKIRTRLNEIKDFCAFKNSDPALRVTLVDDDVAFLKAARLV